MARIRKFCAYRGVERPYTRTSKYRKKNFVKASPNIHIVKYDMGNAKKAFPYKLHLVSRTALQIRHNALESARMGCNRILEEQLGKNGYYLKIRVYPHHLLRENPLASGAGADRMSTGMKMSFGKVIGNAAIIKENQEVITVKVNKNDVDLAKRALKKAASKLPNSYNIAIEEVSA